MEKSDRSKVLTIALAVVLLVAILMFFLRSNEDRPAPSTSGYFSGPMMNKGRTAYSDDKGHAVQAPAGALPTGKSNMSNVIP